MEDRTGTTFAPRRRWRAVAAAAVLCVVGGPVGWGAATPVSADGVATVTFNGPTTLPPGGLIDAEGGCAGGASRATVTAAHSGDPAFEFSTQVTTISADGFFDILLVVPQDAPAGPYRLGVGCYDHDVVLGAGETTFDVDGDPVAPPWVYELDLDRTTYQAGETIAFTGTCWHGEAGPVDEIEVHGERIVPDGSSTEPYSFGPITVSADAEGGFAGALAIPGDAPAPDRYTLSSDCGWDGAALGGAFASFELVVVDGSAPIVPGPSTTEPTVARPPVAQPPAAEPVRAQPSYTG